MADVYLEDFPECLDEHGGVVVAPEPFGELLDRVADGGVLPQHRLDGIVMLDVAMVRIAGHEFVFLIPQVIFAAPCPEAEESSRRLGGRWPNPLDGVAQVVRLDEQVSVLA